MEDFEKIINVNSLADAYRKLRKTSKQKLKIRVYGLNLLDNIFGSSRELAAKTYVPQKTYKYRRFERGKERAIRVNDICDGVIQRSIYDNALLPKIENKFIYDNGASRKDKGISHARKRCVVHLSKYYRRYKTNEGYCLTIDFKKYFDNIRHDVLYAAFEKYIADSDVMWLLKTVVGAYSIDVSTKTNEEIKQLYYGLYDSLAHFNDKELGEKYIPKSLGIGSPISQIGGLATPMQMDNYCKIVRQQKYYGRYMDDTYVIARNKEDLKALLEDIKKICSSLGIFINPKKTQITKLSKGFTFLKFRYVLAETGKILKMPSKDRFARERRKLKKLQNLLQKREISFEKILQMYKSWRGTMSKEHCFRSLQSLDELFEKLFYKELVEWRKANKNKLGKSIKRLHV